MKRFSLLTTFLAFLFSVSFAIAAVPQLIPYQGVLYDEQAEAYLDGPYSVTFEIYDSPAGGTPIWTVNRSVSVEKGYFNVMLGEVNPLNSVDFSKQLYLQVTVANGTPYPRTKLGATPYAIQAVSAVDADTAKVAQDVVDGVLTWTKFQPDQIIAGGDLAGTYPNPTLRQGVVLENIEPGSITQKYLAPNVTVPPSGKAGGDLAGNYPDPLIAKGAVKTDRIYDGAVTNEKLADNAVDSYNILDGEVYLSDLNDEVKIMGGDLSGYLPNPVVVGIQNIPVSDATPWDGAVYMYDLASNTWMPVNAAGDIAGPYNDLQIQEGTVTTIEILDGTIMDIDVNANASIQGTKIYPDFGMQDIMTTGDLYVDNAYVTNDIYTTTLSATDVTSLNGTFDNLLVNTTTLINGAVTINSNAEINGTVTGVNNFVLDGEPLTSGDLDGFYPFPIIRDLAVTTAKIADAAVENSKLALDAVETDNIKNSTILTEDIADGQITTAKLAAGSVTNEIIAPDAVTSDRILDGTIVSADLADGTIQTIDIGDGQITTAKLAAGAVTNDIIAADAVTSNKIMNETIIDEDVNPAAGIQGTKIVPNFGAQNVITTGDVTATNAFFTNATYTGVLEAQGNITNSTGDVTVDDNLTVTGTLSTPVFSTTTITATNAAFTNLTVTNPIVGSMTGVLSDGAGVATFNYDGSANATVAVNFDGTTIGVDGSDNLYLVDAAVTTAKIADLNVTNGKLAGDAVTTDKILDGTIATADIAAGAITNALMAADAINGNNVIDGSLSSADLNSGAEPVGSVMVADGVGGIYWTTDVLTLPYNESYTGVGAAFQITRTSGDGDVIVGVNNGTSGSAGRFESTNTDPALVAINYNADGYAFYAEKNTSNVNQYVAAIANTNANLGRSLLVTNDAAYPGGWVIGSLDPLDQVEAGLVVRNTNAAANKPAIKTYGDIIVNSNVVATELYGVEKIVVGDVNGFYSEITPPTSLDAPIVISGQSGPGTGKLLIDGTANDADFILGTGIELDVVGDARVSGLLDLGTVTVWDLTVNNDLHVNGDTYLGDAATDETLVMGIMNFADATNPTIALDGVNSSVTVTDGTEAVNLDGVSGTVTATGDVVAGGDVVATGDVYGTNGNFTADVVAGGVFSGMTEYIATAGNGLVGGAFDNTADFTFEFDYGYTNTWTATFTGGSFTGTTGTTANAFVGGTFVGTTVNGTVGTFATSVNSPIGNLTTVNATDVFTTNLDAADVDVTGDVSATSFTGGTFAGTTFNGTVGTFTTSVNSPIGNLTTVNATDVFTTNLDAADVDVTGDVSAASFTGGTFAGTTFNGTVGTFTTSVNSPIGNLTTVNATDVVTTNLDAVDVDVTGDVSATSFTGGTFAGTTFNGTVGTFTTSVNSPIGNLTTVNATDVVTTNLDAADVDVTGDVSAATFTGGSFAGTTVNGTVGTFATSVNSPIGNLTTVNATDVFTTNLDAADVDVTGDVNAATFTGGTYSGASAAFTGNVSALTFTQNGNAVLDAATNFDEAVASDATVVGTYDDLDIQLLAGVVGTTEIADATEFVALTADAGSVSLTDASHALTIAGGTNVTTTIAGNTLTIDASVLTDGITTLGDGTLGNEIRVNLANPFIWTGLHTFNAGLNGTFGTFSGNVTADNGFFTTDVTAGGDVVATGNVYGTNGDFTGNLIVGGTSDLQGNVFNSTGLVTVNDGFVVVGASNLQGAVTANNGVTVTAGGVLVQAGGITVNAGGANITGGVGITGALTTTGLITAQAGINTNNNIYNSAADVVIDDNLDLTGNLTQSVDKATILGYSTAADLTALNNSKGTVIAYTGVGPVALANLPAGVNGKVLWFVNASGAILVVDGINVGNNEMVGFVYAAGAWHRMP